MYYYYQPVPDRFINLPCARGQRKKCEAICHALCGSRKHKDSIPKNIEKNTILALLATSISCYVQIMDASDLEPRTIDIAKCMPSHLLVSYIIMRQAEAHASPLPSK